MLVLQDYLLYHGRFPEPAPSPRTEFWGGMWLWPEEVHLIALCGAPDERKMARHAISCIQDPWNLPRALTLGKDNLVRVCGQPLGDLGSLEVLGWIRGENKAPDVDRDVAVGALAAHTYDFMGWTAEGSIARIWGAFLEAAGPHHLAIVLLPRAWPGFEMLPSLVFRCNAHAAAKNAGNRQLQLESYEAPRTPRMRLSMVTGYIETVANFFLDPRDGQAQIRVGLRRDTPLDFPFTTRDVIQESIRMRRDEAIRVLTRPAREGEQD